MRRRVLSAIVAAGRALCGVLFELVVALD